LDRGELGQFLKGLEFRINKERKQGKAMQISRYHPLIITEIIHGAAEGSRTSLETSQAKRVKGPQVENRWGKETTGQKRSEEASKESNLIIKT